MSVTAPLFAPITPVEARKWTPPQGRADIAPSRYRRIEREGYLAIDAHWVAPALLRSAPIAGRVSEPAAGPFPDDGSPPRKRVAGRQDSEGARRTDGATRPKAKRHRPVAQTRAPEARFRNHLRPAQKRPLTRLGQVVDSSLDGDEPAIDVSMKDIVSVWHRRLEVPRTSRSLCQRGGAGERALAICCHDRRPRSPAFGGITSPAAVLLDETRSAAGIFARHRCDRTYQDLNFAIRQYPEQAETESSTARLSSPGKGRESDARFRNLCKRREDQDRRFAEAHLFVGQVRRPRR